ncbi:MAG: YaaR family protein [Desulfotomaculum sp.]|nr:YaaR family protein [Desulfotomaculum sp.]
MKISETPKQTVWHPLPKTEHKNTNAFSVHLNQAHQEQGKQQIMQLLNKIKDVGNKLKSQISEPVVNEYKHLIKEYLAFVLKKNYLLKKENSLDYSTLYLRVEIVDQEIEQLTNELLTSQKDELNIIAQIDKITGLLLDIYQ